jgi:hypothetical protein
VTWTQFENHIHSFDPDVLFDYAAVGYSSTDIATQNGRPRLYGQGSGQLPAPTFNISENWSGNIHDYRMLSWVRPLATTDYSLGVGSQDSEPRNDLPAWRRPQQDNITGNRDCFNISPNTDICDFPKEMLAGCPDNLWVVADDPPWWELIKNSATLEVMPQGQQRWNGRLIFTAGGPNGWNRRGFRQQVPANAWIGKLLADLGSSMTIDPWISLGGDGVGAVINPATGDYDPLVKYINDEGVETFIESMKMSGGCRVNVSGDAIPLLESSGGLDFGSWQWPGWQKLEIGELLDCREIEGPQHESVGPGYVAARETLRTVDVVVITVSDWPTNVGFLPTPQQIENRRQFWKNIWTK